jgi:hypothetical protein
MAIQLLPNLSFPQNNEDQFPVGQQIFLLFDNAVDIKSVKESVILFGPDFDRTSGPNNALWINASTGENPFFLRSPGFKGFVDCDFDLVVLESSDPIIEREEQLVGDRSADISNLVKIIPKNPLKENTQYSLFIIGNTIEDIETLPEELKAFSKNKAISERTVYDPVKAGNLDNRLRSSGNFIPKNLEDDSTLRIKIVKAGIGSEANYIWWFSDEAEPQVANPLYTQRLSRCVQRWRITDRGVLIKFEANDFALNEVFEIKCYKEVRLVDSYLINFSTGTGSIFEYPEYTSTSPIGLDPTNVPIEEELLEVTSISPYNGAINVDLKLKQIVIEFNKEIDQNTVTQETVELLSYPVSGIFDGPVGTRSNRESKIFKIISVESNKIILEL